MRYAAIDIGTNSCRLLIAEKAAGKLSSLYRTMETTRLGENMQANFSITEEAILRTCNTLNNFKAIMREYEVENFRAVATSAVREAGNQKGFIQSVQDKCNINVEVISGEEEAHLSYLGVKNSLDLAVSPLVVDLGGGSTELIMEKDFFISLPVGAVRVYELNLSADDISQILKPLIPKQEAYKANPLVFVGGTATSLVAMKFSLDVYKSELVHGQVLTRGEIADLYNRLEKMPLSLRRRLPGLQPERADIITGGILILLLIMDIFRKEEITVSESDLMEAIIGEMCGL